MCVVFTSGEDDKRRLGLVLGACAMAFAVEGLFAFNVRAPVSAAVIFLLAGLLEGVRAARGRGIRGNPGGLSAGVRWAIAVAVLLGVAAEGRSFLAAFLHQRARGAAYWGDDEASRTRLAWAERLEPWNWQVSRDLAAAEWRLGRCDEAIASLNRSLASHPSFVLTQVDLAKIWCERAADQAAASGSSDVLNGAAAESLERAEGLARAALGLCPVFPEAHEALGLVYAIRARGHAPGEPAGEEAWRQAYMSCHRALRFVEDPVPRARLLGGAADALDALAEVAEAEAMYRAAAQANPGDMSLWRTYTEFAAKRGKWDGLAECLENALARITRAEPWGADRAVPLARQLAHIHANCLDAPDAAVVVLARAIAAVPDRAELWAALADLPKSGAREAALSRAVDASMSRWTSEGVAPLGAVEVLASAYGRDIAALTDAVSRLKDRCASRTGVDPPDVLAHEYGWVAPLVLDEIEDVALPRDDGARLLRDLAALSVMSARWDDANQILLFAVETLPDHEQDSFLLLRAQVLSESNRHAEALGLIRQALNRRPGDTAAQWARARILAAAGRREEARDAYQRLAESALAGEETRLRIEQEMAELAGNRNSGEESGDGQ